MKWNEISKGAERKLIELLLVESKKVREYTDRGRQLNKCKLSIKC